jgi:twitching motility two-component system response regulator PilH
MSQAKILVVEDSPTDMRLVTRLLEENGYSVITATDGEEAIEKAHRERPRLIVLDVILPKKNGFQVCRDLKASAETKDLPVIILTAKNQESDRFWGLKQGANEYITKPWKEEELLQAVAKYV